MPPADHRLTLLTRPGCHLCDTARGDLARIAAELGVRWDERDVTLDQDELARYAEMVPVILLDGVEHGYWRVEEERLRADLGR